MKATQLARALPVDATAVDEVSSPAEGVAMLEPASETDAALVAQARRGDSRAFGQLIRRHLKAAHAVAMSKLGNVQDAEDACQEAFITALERLDQCAHPDRFRSWLMSIVRNRAHNLRDYKAVRAASSLADVGPVPGKSDPAADTDRNELRRRMERALEGLTELQRRVVLLHDYEGWTHAEIGEELGTSAGASRFNLHAARRKLRQLLAGTEGEES